MRVVRIVSHGSSPTTYIIDELSQEQVLDVLRLEPAPIEIHDGRWFGTLIRHDRDPLGNFLYQPDGSPAQQREWVELKIGTIWEIAEGPKEL